MPPEGSDLVSDHRHNAADRWRWLLKHSAERCQRSLSAVARFLLGQGLTNAKPVRNSFALLCIATRLRSGSAGYGTSSAPGSGGSSGAPPACSVLRDAALCAFHVS